MRRAVALLWLALSLSASATLTGCMVVKPWERDTLARPDMAWETDPLESARRGHVYFAKEAAMEGGGDSGGGCGCN